MKKITKSLLENLDNDAKPGMTLYDYMMNVCNGEIDIDVTDTEVDLLVAFCLDTDGKYSSEYPEMNRFLNILAKRTKIVKLIDGDYAPTLECDFSSVFKPYNEEWKEIFNMENSEFDEDDAWAEAVVNLEPLISGNAGESTYKEISDVLESKSNINESDDTESTIDQAARYLFDEGDIEYLPDYEEFSDYTMDISEDLFNKAKERAINALNILEENGYYDHENNGPTYLELNDNSTILELNNENKNQEDWTAIVLSKQKEFKNETGVELYFLGRSGRHVCVEPTYDNCLNFNNLQSIQERLEQEAINEFNEEELTESNVDDAMNRMKQAREDVLNIDKNEGIRKQQLINNIEELVYEYDNGISDGVEEPFKSDNELIDYVYSSVFDIKSDGQGSSRYGNGICKDLKYLGKDYIVSEIKRIGHEAGVVEENINEGTLWGEYPDEDEKYGKIMHEYADELVKNFKELGWEYDDSSSKYGHYRFSKNNVKVEYNDNFDKVGTASIDSDIFVGKDIPSYIDKVNEGGVSDRDYIIIDFRWDYPKANNLASYVDSLVKNNLKEEVDEHLLSLVKKKKDLLSDDTIDDETAYRMIEVIDNEMINSYSIEDIEEAKKQVGLTESTKVLKENDLIGTIQSSGNGFYVGDPCYALDDEDYHGIWGDKHDYSDGLIHLSTGDMIVHGTAYGDGDYPSSEGDFPVDSGTLCIMDASLVKKEIKNLGKIIPGESASLSYNDGIFDIDISNPNKSFSIVTKETDEDDDDGEYYEESAKVLKEETDDEDWKEVCEAFCKKIGATLLFVNNDNFGYEDKDGNLVHMYADELERYLKNNNLNESEEITAEVTYHNEDGTRNSIAGKLSDGRYFSIGQQEQIVVSTENLPELIKQDFENYNYDENNEELEAVLCDTDKSTTIDNHSELAKVIIDASKEYLDDGCYLLQESVPNNIDESNEICVYSNAESEDRSDAESMVEAQYKHEAPNLIFKIRKDGSMYFVDFIGKKQNIIKYLLELGWYTSDEIEELNLIKPYAYESLNGMEMKKIGLNESNTTNTDIEYVCHSNTDTNNDNNYFDNKEDAIKYAEDNKDIIDVVIKVDHKNNEEEQIWWNDKLNESIDQNNLSKEQLWKLRQEIVLGSLYLSDYNNSYGIDPQAVCNFFDSFIEDSETDDYGKPIDRTTEDYDNPEDLYNYYLSCENPFGEIINEDVAIDDDPDLDREQVNTDVDYWSDVDEANTEDVSNMEPSGVYTVSNNFSILVYEIRYDIEDSVLAGDSQDTTKARWRDIIYDDGEPYFYYGDIKVPFNEVMRTDM